MKPGGRKRAASATASARSVVVIGSYREDLAGLLAFSERLTQLGLLVLHPPPRARKVGESSGFVRLDCDLSVDEAKVQRHVFMLIERADAVILYNPSGRVGISAAMELGYSMRACKPIFATDSPEDITLRALIQYEDSALTEFLRKAATSGDRHEHRPNA